MMALFEAPPFFNCNHPLFSSRNSLTAVTSCSASSLPPSSSPKIPEGETTDPNSLNIAPDRSRDRRKVVRLAWEKLVRWSRSWRSKNGTDVLQDTNKVVVLGGGSFGTAMAAHVANRKAHLEVHMLLRDPLVCQSINDDHCNCKYFPEHKLPDNVIATTDPKTALLGADYCLHAVPVQFSSSFLEGISKFVDPGLPFISLSKGLELNTLRMMSQIIPQALKNPRQPFVALSGPSFALELMNKLPTAMVVASKDKKLANATQQLLASSHLRISTSSDVTGVEIAGALKNVLAIAAGIVEGMNLGNNSMAALVAQGCSEIRWLATKMGAKPATITGLSGTGDIMLTCFVNLSRNKTVGVRLGSGEQLDDILNSMNQVAEGVSTAGAVIALAQKYNVKMPVLTAVARIIDNELTPKKAVLELMRLPQQHLKLSLSDYRLKKFEKKTNGLLVWLLKKENSGSRSRKASSFVQNLKGMIVSGGTVWRNPDGCLPRKMAPMMTFFVLMSLAYLALGLCLVYLVCEVLERHYSIALSHYSCDRPMGITLWAVTFSAVKKTVCRWLLLVVSMGYGVVRPTLGGITSKVMLLGIAYFIASEELGFVENLGNINDFSGKAMLVPVLPVALLDACFIICIFSSLSQTLEKLQIRRSAAKFALYQKFTNFLAVAVLISIAWIGYEEMDEESIPLSVSRVKVVEDLATKLEREERKASTAPEQHVLELGEDLEEDKRE
ncbi:hypothetical protein GH714_008150 [Hevea brasiliensis]|uniref:Glycerol-3-phosphate dehydrogenase [NAD(+)] n=1 Tax=Hevea brasiliensis TaxID=3981 RepID=A0A6A6LZU7_HEVBR|nr:hypothetical protein GH714_008150 [Hevea brasiliensis]